MRLLIVDDSNVIRGRIARAVASLGLNVVGSARNGDAALAIVREHGADVVTMDLTMPGMDGLECIARLRAVAPQADILVVSALADKATAVRALTLGARGFLCKPFTEEELCEALADLLAARSEEGRHG